AGLWYLGVFKRDFGPVRYTVLAKELDTAPNIIELSNGVPFNFTAGPGAALTNFFHFGVAGNPGLTNAAGIHFELYNQSGNGDLTVQTNAVPLAPPFYQTSRQPGVLPEFISIRTNSAQTNLFTTALTNLNVDWYLGVPNNTAAQISYTILAVLDTNSVFPAFPGAEGAGAGAMGGGGPATGSGHGTNGTVYHVVNLNDSGAGSLRDAVSSTNRTIVFDVSGTINLASRLVITNSYLTIAGQTAPGGGITVAGYETSVTNAHDVIIRYLRFRPDTNGFDALRFISVSNVIADHVSAEWSPLQNSAALDSANLTVQWSMISDSLFSTNTPNGGTLLRFGNGAVTLHHNLYANNFAGSPHLDDNLSLDFVNNVIYGWGTNAGFSFGTNNPAGFTNQLNYVCNYLIASTNSFAPTIAFRGGSTNTWIYQTNNFIDSDTNGILNGADTGWDMFTNRFTQIGQPFPLPPVSTDEAFLAYEKVLDFAGAGLFLRDSVDADIVTGVRNQTGTIISTPPTSGMVAWWKAENNALDSVGNNNGSLVGGVPFAAGEVGQAFQLNQINSYMSVPASPSLNVGLTGGFTIEGWIKISDANGLHPICEWDSRSDASPGSGSIGVIFCLGTSPGSAGVLACLVNDTNGIGHLLASPSGTIVTNSWQHVAATYDRTSGVGTLYVNGLVVLQQSLGSFVPQTSYNFWVGYRPGDLPGDWTYNTFLGGLLDELSVYQRALSSSEIASIYNAGSAGKFSAGIAALPYLDTDRDGIPDFWETTFGQFPTNVSNFLPSSTAPGYTDLEEYLNWLGAPHALTITNTSVGVDLYQLCGNSGNLSFFLTNAVNGTVYLTNVLSYTNSLGIGINVTNTGPFSNRYAIFTPPTNSSGYASFGFYVTNNATVAYFGPVTVSVVVSSVPIVYAADNTNVPPVFVNGSLTNQTFNELTLLTVTNAATLVNTNLSLSYAVTLSIDAAAMSASNWPNTYVTTTPSPAIDASGVITWTPSEAQGPGVYLITTVATDNSFPPLTATNSFSVVVNEVNLAPFWPTNVPSQTNYTVSATTTLIVTNTASDLDIPTNALAYALSVSPAVTNAAISTNGIITWTPTPAQVGLYTFTTIVTDTNPYALFNQSLSNTNVFTVLVTAVAAPFVFTEPAQAVTGTNGQLNGMVTPNGLPTTAWYQWGTSVAYGNQTPPVNVGNGYNVVYTTNKIGSLTLNVPYHFRLVAANAAGTNYGFDQILDEANVVAWGANYVGQGAVPAGLSNVTAIAGAYDHSLALKNNGTVVSWGNNTLGYLTVPSNLTNVLAVAGGEYYSMALKNNGTVTAWGANVFPGQTNVPAGLSNVVVIAGGTFSSIALKNNGSVVAGGANIFGVINVPASASNTVAVAGGFFHSLAIKNDGTVFGWGDNSAGQLTVPAGVTNAVAIAAGNAHSLALKYDGTVVAWGDNGDGQTDVPPGLTNVVAIAAGGFNSMALKNDGKIVTWGDNTTGQSSVPVGLTNAVAIAGGNLHSLALTPQSSASLTNPVVVPIVNGVPQTNNILPGSITYYQVDVPANATFATNSLLFASGTLNVWFTTNVPPTIAKTNDSLLLGALTNGVSVLSLTSAPTNIIPGRTYYLGVQNTNSVTVNYGIEVDFHLVPPVPPAISGIIFTNGGFLLTWFAPSNDLFQVQFTTNLAPANWTTFTNIISYNTNAPGIPPNAQFNFFDDGVLYPFGPTRFYRLILLAAPVVPTNSAPVFIGNPATQTINPLAALVVTNAATDADVPAQTLTYTLLNPPVGAVINPTNGLITWTPSLAQAGTSNTLATVVTDSGTPNLSATNSFAVLVNPIPVISSVTYISSGTTNGFLVKWYAPTNDQFKVQWTTNLAPVNWQTFSNLVTYTGPATLTTGLI
ncbi:MAG: LamG-like jellyroll fold domain-containing protein, partial [Verrucomicrobiota bacterium]